VRSPDTERKALRLGLTRERIENGPDFDSDKPVSRQYEAEHFGYYGYPLYWTGP
jgi:stress response protein YsnF